MRGLLIPSAICLFFMLVLSGCSYRLSVDNIDIAAKQLITDFDVSFKGKDNSTVTSIGFKVLGEDSLAFNPLLLEESLNHYLSLSRKFKVIEYGKEKTDKLLRIIMDQMTGGRLYKNSVELGEFENLNHVVTGTVTIQKDKVEIRARLIDLKSLVVIAVSKITFPLKPGPGLLILYWGIGIFALSMCYSIMKKVFSHNKAGQGIPDSFGEKTCGVCGAKIKNLYQRGGKCITPVCDNEICTHCWNGDRIRKCSECTATVS
jgi:hypothetical protein